MTTLSGSLKFTRMDGDLGEGGRQEGEGEDLLLPGLTVINALTSIGYSVLFLP